MNLSAVQRVVRNQNTFDHNSVTHKHLNLFTCVKKGKTNDQHEIDIYNIFRALLFSTLLVFANTIKSMMQDVKQIANIFLRTSHVVYGILFV